MIERIEAEQLELMLDLPVPDHEGVFYRVQLPPHGVWSHWFAVDESCPFDYVLSVQLHNIDLLEETYQQVMRQFQVGESKSE